MRLQGQMPTRERLAHQADIMSSEEEIDWQLVGHDVFALLTHDGCLRPC